MKRIEVMRYLVIFCFVASIAPGIDGRKIRTCHQNGRWSEIRESEICCDGIVEPKDPYNDKDCCGGNFYFKKMNNVPVLDCCRSQIFNTSTHLCCDHKLYNLSESNKMECCGKEVIDPTTEMCCRGDDNLVSRNYIHENLECCGHDVININVKQCVYDHENKPKAIYRQQEYCENSVIELTKKMCCNDVISNIPFLDPRNHADVNPNAACCHETGYNTMNQTCCLSDDTNGFVIPKTDHLICCGSGTVDIRSEHCCSGQAVMKSEPTDQCCGTEIINSSRQGCCDGQSFNVDTQYCCRGVGRPSLPLQKNQTCCGGEELGSDNICCDNAVQVPKETPLDDQCCLSWDDTYTYTPYDSKNKECANGMVVTALGPNDRRCHGTRYLPDEAVCCNSRVHAFPRGQTIGCCTGNDLSETLYDTNTQMCCWGKLYNKSSSEYECCGYQTVRKYKGDNSCHLCESNTVKGNACCGSESFFSRTSKCCGGKLYDRHDKHHKQCSSQNNKQTRTASGSVQLQSGLCYLITTFTVVLIIAAS